MSDDRGAARPFPWRLVGWTLFLLFVVVWSGQNAFRCSADSPLVGHPAPPFDGAIAAGDGVGDRVSSASALGQPVLLDFWASWCAPCRASIPIVSRIAREHRSAGLVTLGVNVESDRSESHVARAHDALGAGFPTLHDRGWAMQSAYDVHTIPTLVVIDRRGVVRRVEIGVPSESDLDAEIREILREDP